MRRWLLTLVVGLLCATTSGVFELVVPDQCALEQASSGTDDGACPPTCLQCHCARPFDVVVSLPIVDVLLGRAEWAEPLQSLPAPAPHDVLHVPRPAAA